MHNQKIAIVDPRGASIRFDTCVYRADWAQEIDSQHIWFDITAHLIVKEPLALDPKCSLRLQWPTDSNLCPTSVYCSVCLTLFFGFRFCSVWQWKLSAAWLIKYKREIPFLASDAAPRRVGLGCDSPWAWPSIHPGHPLYWPRKLKHNEKMLRPPFSIYFFRLFVSEIFEEKKISRKMEKTLNSQNVFRGWFPRVGVDWWEKSGMRSEVGTHLH